MKLLIARRFGAENESYINIPVTRAEIDDSLVFGYRKIETGEEEEVVAILSIGSFDAIYINEQNHRTISG